MLKADVWIKVNGGIQFCQRTVFDNVGPELHAGPNFAT